MSGLLRPLIAGPARHLVRLVREPEYRTLARLEATLGGRPRYQPGHARARGMELAFPDAASFLSSYHEIFVAGHYAFLWPDRPLRLLDLGANIGLSVLFFKRAHPQAEILALEADPGIFAYLERNVRGNGLGDVELLQRAAWDRDTRISFRSDGADGGRAVATGGGQGSAEVGAIDIAAFVARRPFDVIKMDIEGAEAVVLPACRAGLARARFVAVEYHSSVGEPQSLAEILAVLKGCGFRVHVREAITSPAPFVSVRAHAGFDLQLNLFAWKP
jgi:FkbM family methyltransferase